MGKNTFDIDEILAEFIEDVEGAPKPEQETRKNAEASQKNANETRDTAIKKESGTETRTSHAEGMHNHYETGDNTVQRGNDSHRKSSDSGSRAQDSNTHSTETGEGHHHHHHHHHHSGDAEDTTQSKRESQENKINSGKQRQEEKKTGTPLITAAATIVFIAGLLFCLVNVHPAATLAVRQTPAPVSMPVQTESPKIDNSPAESEQPKQEEHDQQTEEPQPEEEEISRPAYSIPREAAAAYKPDSACFGEISLDNSHEAMSVIQKARDSGLLGKDERVVFDPNAEFNRGSHSEPIMYYLDDSLMVICWKEIIDGNTCTLSEIKIADGSQFRKKVVGDINSTNETDYVTSIALGSNAVVAFGADKLKARPEGIVIQNGELFRYNDAVRTGAQKMYNSLDNLLVTASGDFIFTHRYEEFTREELEQKIRDNDVIFSLAFGPILVENGVLNEEYWPVDPNTEYAVGQIFDEYSRAGIAQVGNLHYLYMSLNHSEEKLARWTMEEFAKHFAEKDVINAYGLDGGQTSEVVFNNYIYSYIDHNNERLTSDALYFGSAIPR